MIYPIIKIEKHYRSTVSFVIFQKEDRLYKIESVSVKISKLFSASIAPINAEALHVPNTYEIVLTPSHNVYPLFPLTKNSSSFWVLKGKNDIEFFNITFEWLKQMSVLVYLEAKVTNVKNATSKVIKSEEYLLERNGETTSDREYLPSYGSLKDSFSLILYKVLISKNYSFIEFISKDEISPLMKEINSYFNDKLLGKKIDMDLNFESDLHPLIASRLIPIFSILKYSIENDNENIWIFEPNFYGIGVNFKNIVKKLKNKIANNV